jgi:hypothetical protein
VQHPADSFVYFSDVKISPNYDDVGNSAEDCVTQCVLTKGDLQVILLLLSFLFLSQNSLIPPNQYLQVKKVFFSFQYREEVCEGKNEKYFWDNRKMHSERLEI